MGTNFTFQTYVRGHAFEGQGSFPLRECILRGGSSIATDPDTLTTVGDIGAWFQVKGTVREDERTEEGRGVGDRRLSGPGGRGPRPGRLLRRLATSRHSPSIKTEDATIFQTIKTSAMNPATCAHGTPPSRSTLTPGKLN